MFPIMLGLLFERCIKNCLNALKIFEVRSMPFKMAIMVVVELLIASYRGIYILLQNNAVFMPTIQRWFIMGLSSLGSRYYQPNHSLIPGWAPGPCHPAPPALFHHVLMFLPCLLNLKTKQNKQTNLFWIISPSRNSK